MRAVRPRLGFAGLGWIGRHRMEAIAAEGVAEIAALQDPAPEALAAAAGIVPGAVRVRSFEHLLDHGLDGIVIASPSALHSGQAMAALGSGAAVFCQKPLGRTADEAARVVALARARDLLLGLDLCYPRTAAVRAMRDALDEGRIGRLFAADLVFHNAYGPDKPWFYDLAQSGGGAMIDLGTHLVGLALDLYDAPVDEVVADLYASGTRLSGRLPLDRAAHRGVCSRGPSPVSAIWRIASNSSRRPRRAGVAPGLVEPAAILQLARRVQPEEIGRAGASQARATSWLSSCR
jgi:predicted dehydrogenase